MGVETDKETWEEKAVDYNRFSLVLICLAAFLSIGFVIPQHAGGWEMELRTILLVSVIVVVALLFRRRSTTYVRKLEEEDMS